ncbi:phage replication-related protein YjqB (UPF0714/DUF867 family) [Sinorhizobium fredii]
MRCDANRCVDSQRFHGVFISARGIFYEPKIPVVASGRKRIKAKRLVQMVDARGSVASVRAQLSPE